MPNARNLCLGPNATYIPLTCVWVSCWGTRKICVTNMLVSFALGGAKVPNANGFVSHWNIGFKLFPPKLPTFGRKAHCLCRNWKLYKSLNLLLTKTIKDVSRGTFFYPSSYFFILKEKKEILKKWEKWQLWRFSMIIGLLGGFHK